MKVIVAFLFGLLAVQAQDACTQRAVNDGGTACNARETTADPCCLFTAAVVDDPGTTTVDETADATCEDSTVCNAADCDNAAGNWDLTWQGASTQFEFSDPCTDNYVRVKVASLVDTNGAKITTLASSANNAKDGPEGAVVCFSFDKSSDPVCGAACTDPETENCGVYALQNELSATLKNVGDGTTDTEFTLTATLLRDDYSYEVTDAAGTHTVNIKRNEIKFGFEITGWPAVDDNVVTVTINVKTAGEGTFEAADGGTTISGDGFEFKNEPTFTCDGTPGNDKVATSVDVNGGGSQADLIYAFTGNCADITYDPILSQLNGAGRFGVVFAVFVGLMAALFN